MSDKVKHTPGPLDWTGTPATASGGFHAYITDANGRKIAALWGGAEEKVANAHLFCAATELLGALSELHAAATGKCGMSMQGWKGRQARDRAAAAIAKATGAAR